MLKAPLEIIALVNVLPNYQKNWKTLNQVLTVMIVKLNDIKCVTLETNYDTTEPFASVNRWNEKGTLLTFTT